MRADTFNHNGMRKINVLFLVFLILLLISKVYGHWMEDGVRFIRVIGWFDFLWLGLGWLFAHLQAKAGLPEILGTVKQWKKWMLPFTIGVAFAILDVWVIEGMLRNEAHTTLPPYTQPFPYSILLYFAGGLHMEIVYKLIPLTAFLLIIERFVHSGVKKYLIFLIVFLLSIWEPLEQMPLEPKMFIAYSLLSGFAFNFIQLYFFRKWGWIYSLICRLGLYLVWHVLLGVWIEFFQLT
ncbi:hypothetical protein [Pararhodonellum marinum]|uniref:hypothetical protein n=1 Tax=Pararhodonellum marinum TaxID=2755358 RepID=UPI0018907D51|nr:hypothetical protein [Pararhodonellum marinum]